MALEKYWYTKNWLSCCLWLPSLLFRLLIAIRRMAYRSGLFSSYIAQHPVVVIGNITVGGSGKTPVLVALVGLLKAAGFSPGIVSRGYAAQAAGLPQFVSAGSDPCLVGDEPVLIAKKTRCPVSVCKDRWRAVQALEAGNSCDIILSDDGLQHYAMQRTVEIICIDGQREFGNGLMLPAGPLREPVRRLREADFVIAKNRSKNTDDYFTLQTEGVYQLGTGREAQSLGQFRDQRVHAVAGIANPDSFFELLSAHGIRIVEHPLPDHHNFSAQDFDFAENLPILMTEKDAVKCKKLALDDAWFVAVGVSFCTNFPQQFLALLRDKKHTGFSANG